MLSDDGSPALRDLPTPRPRPGEVLVRVTAVGLCGSDVEKFGDGGGIAGAVLGHEISGVVEEGPLAPGTRVVVAHRVPCGACADCAAGHETSCPQYLASGLRPGGFAEYCVASATHVGAVVLPLPDAVSDVAGTFVEPLACAVRGAARLPRGTGVVAGCGAVGRLCARLLRARGDTVYGLDADPARLLTAAADGFEPPPTDARLDYAVVTSAGAVDDALRLLRPGGTCLVFAAPPGTQPVTLDLVYRRELTVVGSRSATPTAMREALALITDGAVAVEDLATDLLPLTSFAEGVARYRSRRALKVVFLP